MPIARHRLILRQNELYSIQDHSPTHFDSIWISVNILCFLGITYNSSLVNLLGQFQYIAWCGWGMVIGCVWVASEILILCSCLQGAARDSCWIYQEGAM